MGDPLETMPSITTAQLQDRRNIYYWKCDRPAAFRIPRPHIGNGAHDEIAAMLLPLLRRRMNETKLTLQPAPSPGNHLLYLAVARSSTFIVRIENGPEHDDYMEIEARVLDMVRQAGPRTPLVCLADSSRQEVPFAFQVLEYVPYPDLNTLYKNGHLSLLPIAEQIGSNIARWQSIQPPGFGPFGAKAFRTEGKLVGLHDSYETYFRLNLTKHLGYLEKSQFLSTTESDALRQAIDEHANMLDNRQGCLVHKDVALWNVLGTSDCIHSFIDWDDAISGDPTDDLSLLACFHAGDVVAAAIRGYQMVRPLPEDFSRRFWLHLLRNMIVKATIRVGAGYFEQVQSFFLLPNGGSGKSLKHFTRNRLRAAHQGLRENRSPDVL